LKELGLSLEQISRLLDLHISPLSHPGDVLELIADVARKGKTEFTLLAKETVRSRAEKSNAPQDSVS
jgi:hypothetical protein